MPPRHTAREPTFGAPDPAPEPPPNSPPPAPRAAPPPAKPRRRRGLFGSVLRFVLTLAFLGIVGGAIGGAVLWRQVADGLPDYAWLADYQPPQMSRIYAADSRLLAELASERRVFVPIEAIPPRLLRAFVSAEDQRFWEHRGVDPIGILRAAVTNLEQYGSGRRAVGASTITQQVAKNMLVGADRTLTRKLKEAILATRIEAALTKERILELYLNEIYLGAQAYGVAAAAQAYFNKGLDELSTAEMAFLAALPKAPNNLNPVRFPDAARARRDYVLDRMQEDGVIDAAEAARAKAEPINPRPTRRPDVLPVGQYFTEEVRRELISRFGQDQAAGGGLVVRTSLDPALQAATEQALRTGLLNYDRRRGAWRGPLGRISAGAADWLPQLTEFGRPGGLLPEWRVAVVLDIRGNEARLGLVERPDPRGPVQPRIGSLAFEDVTWRRRATGENRSVGVGRLGDLLSPGDVVAVQPRGGSDRYALRQMPEVEGAVVALDPATGRVLAMAGGWSFDRSQFNRATQAQRQPGSSFKPFVYLPALEAGVPPNQRFLDGPIEINTGAGIWRPTNYGGGSGTGYVSIRTALEKSLNLVTVRIAQEVGMDKVSETAGRFGVIDNMPRFIAMSLGSGETTVLRMAAGYAGFASGGKRVVPTLIDSVQDRRGRVIWRSDARACAACASGLPDAGPPALTDERRQIADPIAAYQMTNILTGVVQRGTGTRAGQGLGRPIAGKTGTTNDFFDNWFVGYTPDIVIAVWLGFDDPHTLGYGEAGGTNAAPIFREVLDAALRGSPPVPFRAPPGVALVRATASNGDQILEAFVPGTEVPQARPAAAREGGIGIDRGLGGLY